MSTWCCPVCGYAYEESAGHPREGFPPGTPWTQVPDDWHCPDCGVRDKVDFVSESQETAGESAASGRSTPTSPD